jgi:hypothetical protein
MPRGIPAQPKLPATCPPVLHQLIKQEGSRVAVARKLKAGTNTINELVNGKKKLTDTMRLRIEAALKDAPHVGGDALPPKEAEPPPIVVPPWDKKMGTVKITKTDGSKQTFKVPAPIALLFERHDNVKNEVGRALGYSGWNPVNDQITKGKYVEKLHARAYAALNGLPIPGVANRRNGDGEQSIPDGFTLSIAICLVTLSEFERLEEIAEVLGGSMVFKMSAGATGWIVIYKMSARARLEQFKRLGRRDAKRIVCP